MIVRISGEDQYRLADSDAERLKALETDVAQAAESGQEERFEQAYRALLEHVRSHGARVGDDELESSDLILPPADITLAESAGDFTGDGLIPD